MLEVIGVIIVVLIEDDDIVDVHQAHTPTDTGEDDIKRTLEGLGRTAKTKRHAEISVSPHVTRELCLISILFGDGHLPVSPESFKERKDHGPRQAIDVLIHSRERIGVRDSSHFEAP